MPMGLNAALADSAATHFVHGRAQSGAELPDGYRVVWHSIHRPGGAGLRAALFAPSPSGPARVCTGRFSGTFAAPGAARILAAAARYAPALADSPDICPRPARVARLLSYGHAQLTPEPGLLVYYGPLALWLHRRRLQLNAGRGNDLTLALDGSCEAHSTARLADHILSETGGGRHFAWEVGSELPTGARALPDEWHPRAAVVFLTDPADLTVDPLGREHSRRYRDLRQVLTALQPDWRVQNLSSNEGSTVALRVTASDAVPPLFKHIAGSPYPPGAAAPAVAFEAVYRPCPRGCPHHPKSV